MHITWRLIPLRSQSRVCFSIFYLWNIFHVSLRHPLTFNIGQWVLIHEGVLRSSLECFDKFLICQSFEALVLIGGHISWFQSRPVLRIRCHNSMIFLIKNVRWRAHKIIIINHNCWLIIVHTSFFVSKRVLSRHFRRHILILMLLRSLTLLTILVLLESEHLPWIRMTASIIINLHMIIKTSKIIQSKIFTCQYIVIPIRPFVGPSSCCSFAVLIAHKFIHIH